MPGFGYPTMSKGWGGAPKPTVKTPMQQLMEQQSQAGLAGQQAQNAHQTQQTQNITPRIDPRSVLGSGLNGPDVTQGAYEGYQGNQQHANLQAGAEDRRWGMLQPLIDKFMSHSSSSSSGQGPANIKHVDLPGISGMEDAARRATLARAQDTAGQTGRAAMNSLSDLMGSRGLSGSNLHMADASGIINAGAEGMGEVTREQQINDLTNARQRASEQYEGDITQRGQDIAQDQFTKSQSESSTTRNQSALMALLAQLTSRY